MTQQWIDELEAMELSVFRMIGHVDKLSGIDKVQMREIVSVLDEMIDVNKIAEDLKASDEIAKSREMIMKNIAELVGVWDK